jgi:hypothetical protein
MRVTTRGRGIRENRLVFGSRLCAVKENIMTELTPSFEWPRRIITLEAFRAFI